MSNTSEKDLIQIAKALKPIGMDYAFGGGAVIGLLIDQTPFYKMRPTDDVDVIVSVIAGQRYSDLEAEIRKQDFEHDMTPGAPKCRWHYQGIVVDIMPSNDPAFGLNTRWFPEALKTATLMQLDEHPIPVITAPAFVATKYEAFLDRGENDFLGSHDLEDIICVVDHRESLVDELQKGDSPICHAAIGALTSLWESALFREALPGHLPPDAASQRRLDLLEHKFKTFSSMKI